MIIIFFVFLTIHLPKLPMTSHANNATHMKIIVPAMDVENYQGTQISSIFYSLSPRQNGWMDRWDDGGGRTTNGCEAKEEQLRPQLSRER
jgi:hypothetical protein